MTIGIIGLITAAMKVKAEIKTANFVDAVAQLRANFTELSAQEKLDLIEQLLGDNPREDLKLLQDAGVDINMLFNAINSGVNSGDAFKLKQLIAIAEGISGVGELSVNGISTIEEAKKLYLLKYQPMLCVMRKMQIKWRRLV